MSADPIGDYLAAFTQAGFGTEDPDEEAAAPALDALLGSGAPIPDELIGAVGEHVRALDGNVERGDTAEVERSIARISKVREYSTVPAEARRFPPE